MLTWIRRILTICMLLGLFACGGGGLSDDGDGVVEYDLRYAPHQGTVGVFYKYSPIYWTSKSISEHFEISGGRLPPGLGISAGDGVISGTPDTPGTYYFTVRLSAKEVQGSVYASGTIVIKSDISATLNFAPPAATMGQAYSYQPVFSTNKPVTPIFSASGLPSGLSIDPASGLISGTPTGWFSSMVYLTVSAPGMDSVTRSSMLVVNPALGGSSSSSSSGSSSSGGSSSSSGGIPPATLGYAPQAGLEFGGSTGRQLSDTQNITLNLNRSGTYNWTLVSAPNWLGASKTSGTLGSASDSISLSLNPSKQPTGHTSGSIHIQAVVGSETIDAYIPVLSRRDTQRLIASENGVAFTNTPQWTRLTKTVTVRDNFGSATWSASSNQPWLSVTASDTSGAPLTLTANPTGLTPDQTHLAEVTITAPGAKTETITVGLWNGSSTPSARTTVGTKYTHLAIDPVRPLAYVSNGSSGIDVYHLYTGLKVDTIASPGQNFTVLEPSSDGKWLFAGSGFNIHKIDLGTRTLLATYAATVDLSSLRFIRPDGEPLLVTNKGAYYSTDSLIYQTALLDLRHGAAAVSQDSTLWASLITGVSPDTLSVYGLEFAVGTLRVTSKGSVWFPGSNCKDVAFSNDKAYAYTACGAPYVFARIDIASMTASGSLPGTAYPNNVAVANDGRIFAGAFNWYDSKDFWVYRPNGTEHSSYLVRGYAQEMLDRQLQPSSDGLMAVVLTTVPNLQIIPVGPDTVQSSSAGSAAKMLRFKPTTAAQ